MKLIFVLGGTGSGKTTFLEEVASKNSNVGMTSVGRLLVAKYGASYFNGQAAPENTEVEAMSLMKDEIFKHKQNKKSYVLVDGQPRKISQLEIIEKTYEKPFFLHLYAPLVARKQRQMVQYSKDQAGMNLRLARLDNEYKDLYEVLSVIHHKHRNNFVTFDTSTSAMDYSSMFQVIKDFAGENNV